jgi:hypothetical protein
MWVLTPTVVSAVGALDAGASTGGGTALLAADAPVA